MIESIKQFLIGVPGQEPALPAGRHRPKSATRSYALAAWELGLEDRAPVLPLHRPLDPSRAPVLLRGDRERPCVRRRTGAFAEGKVGDPSSNFVYIEPESPSQLDYQYSEDEVYVVPNPATTASMQPWTLSPNNDDPTGIKVEFRNLPPDRGTIRIYHDGRRPGRGAAVRWP